ncbi:DUF6366 family protein [Neobacillus pocheonensis]|uniref:DUF6366 family protein n=1 Tax=Neobacillus pocheonensis TaxID=363869 RepID=A0ABT0WJG0_9BACI|nr:DUF6366 family protein [Neobacillus pocheonensis]
MWVFSLKCLEGQHQVGSLGLKGTGILVLVIIIGFIIVSVFFK